MSIDSIAVIVSGGRRVLFRSAGLCGKRPFYNARIRARSVLEVDTIILLCSLDDALYRLEYFSKKDVVRPENDQ